MKTIINKYGPVIRSVAWMALPLLSCTEPQAEEKPNILWITIEDTSPHFLGCYGNEQVKTPNIDQLASEGIMFTSAFANAPVCSAARSTLITGLPNELSGNGNHRSAMPLPEHIQGFPTYLRQLGYYTSNNSKTDYNTANEEAIIHSSWNESSDQAGWWNRDSLQPFFSVFNYMESHQSRTMTNPWKWYEEHVINHLETNELTDENEIEMPPFYRDSPEMRKHVNRVYNSLNLTDKRIGELLNSLKEDGLMESTIIFLYADHGEGMPRGKSNSIGFSYRVPFIIWFPEKYKHLSPWGHETLTDELISFIDLAPTILSLTGAPIPEYMTGRPFLGDQRKDASGYEYGSRNRIDETPGLERIITDGRYIYTRVFLPQFPALRYQKYNDVGDVVKVIRKDHSLGWLNPIQEEMLLERESEYLYDLHHDPWEIRNLAGIPEYEDKVLAFRNALKHHNLQSKDVHFLPEYEMVNISEHTTPYEYRLEHSGIMENAIEAAWQATDREADPELLFEMMNHGEPLVRYWAATGLKINKSKLSARVEELNDFIDDDYPPVQIQMAGLAYELTREDRAKKVLEQHIFSDNMYQSLQALQLVLYMEDGLRKDFVPAVNRLVSSLPDRNLSNTLNVMSTSELILYLEEGRPLYYDFMLRWVR